MLLIRIFCYFFLVKQNTKMRLFFSLSVHMYVCMTYYTAFYSGIWWSTVDNFPTYLSSIFSWKCFSLNSNLRGSLALVSVPIIFLYVFLPCWDFRCTWPNSLSTWILEFEHRSLCLQEKYLITCYFCIIQNLIFAQY